jgi:hypothetical protein
VRKFSLSPNDIGHVFTIRAYDTDLPNRFTAAKFTITVMVQFAANKRERAMPDKNKNGDERKQPNTKPSTNKWDASACVNVYNRQEDVALNSGLNQANEVQGQLTNPIILSSLAAKRLALFFKRGHGT